jgi:predicted RNA binding protein YcfA (HicA-like mRNA interferase family)
MGVRLDGFPSMRWPRLRRILEREPLNYRIVHQSGSHRKMQAPNRPELHLAFHDRTELPGGLVRKILVQDIGLTEKEALDLL